MEKASIHFLPHLTPYCTPYTPVYCKRHNCRQISTLNTYGQFSFSSCEGLFVLWAEVGVPVKNLCRLRENTPSTWRSQTRYLLAARRHRSLLLCKKRERFWRDGESAAGGFLVAVVFWEVRPNVSPLDSRWVESTKSANSR